MAIDSYNLLNRLRVRYKAPEFAFFAEVSSGTGGYRGRRADGLAMNLWPSRGLSIIGFEIKVTRSDVCNELKNPAKAEAIAQYCDYWYLVVSNPDLVRPGELPPQWGLLVPYRNGLRQAVDAKQMESKPITRQFLASILRHRYESDAVENQIRDAVDKAVNESKTRWIEYGERQAGPNLKGLQERYDKLLAHVEAFKEQSGIDFTDPEWKWREDYGKELGEKVHMLMKLGPDHFQQRLGYLEGSIDALKKDVEKAKAVFA